MEKSKLNFDKNGRLILPVLIANEIKQRLHSLDTDNIELKGGRTENENN